jgi:hypothetical protein
LPIFGGGAEAGGCGAVAASCGVVTQLNVSPQYFISWLAAHSTQFMRAPNLLFAGSQRSDVN